MAPRAHQLRSAAAAALLARFLGAQATAGSLNATAVGDRPAPFGAMGCGTVRNSDGGWVFNAGSGIWPSCDTPVRGDGAYMCVDNGVEDPTSIFVDMASVAAKTGCFAWQTSACSFDLKRVHQITFSVDIHNCEGVWAAPLWLSPSPWNGPGQLSGEIDLVEMCPRGSVATNFGSPGGPGEHQEIWGSAVNLGGPRSFTMTLDQNSGTLSTRVCNLDGSGCFSSAYYNNFLQVVNSAKAGGPTTPYNFNVDVWNGHGGDGGWTGCGAQNDANSQCQFAVRNIRIHTVDGRPLFASGKCAALNGGAVEVEAPNPSRTDANETIVLV